MTEKTVLNETHRALGARMVDFGGWDMPLNYGSQIEEHHAVRRAAGMFDVSHMNVVDVTGGGAPAFLKKLLANSIDKLKVPGKALYSCMLNEQGGVIDDLIVYWLGGDEWRLVGNAGTRAKDMAWLQRQAEGFDVEIRERRDLAIIAVQGPKARDIVLGLLNGEALGKAEALAKFGAADVEGPDGVPLFLARTGYTGEDGFEIVLPAGDAVAFWQRLAAAGVVPAGLGARDTLRLEAGLNLYGQDMDEHTTPLEAGLGWTVSFDEGRDFIGRAALESQQAAGVPRALVALVMDERGVLRQGQKVFAGEAEGAVVSGGFSPTLGKAIALARVPSGADGPFRVEIRGREVPVRKVRAPFVRAGQPAPGV